MGLSGVLKLWAALKGTDLPALTQQLRSATLSEIHLESNATKQDESEDIE